MLHGVKHVSSVPMDALKVEPESLGWDRAVIQRSMTMCAKAPSHKRLPRSSAPSTREALRVLAEALAHPKSAD